MLTADDVACFFIVSENKKEHGSMTNLRLNKMLYFAQIFSMLELDEPLFQDNIEAWDLGPVIPPVYYQYKRYKRAPITETIEPDFNEFSPEQIRLLFDVYSMCENKATSHLVDISHSPGSPWYNTYHSNSPSQVIPTEEMESFVEGLRKKYAGSYTLRSDFLISQIPESETVIGEDGNRYYVLPEE